MYKKVVKKVTKGIKHTARFTVSVGYICVYGTACTVVCVGLAAREIYNDAKTVITNQNKTDI